MINFNEFPYTNFHELNLDWILAELKDISQKINTAGVLPAPIVGQEGWVATVIDGDWVASDSVINRISALEGDNISFKANFATINRKLDEIYASIEQANDILNQINRTVIA